MNKNVIDAKTTFGQRDINPFPVIDYTVPKIRPARPGKRTQLFWLNMEVPGILTIMDTKLPEPFPN